MDFCGRLFELTSQKFNFIEGIIEEIENNDSALVYYKIDTTIG